MDSLKIGALQVPAAASKLNVTDKEKTSGVQVGQQFSDLLNQALTNLTTQQKEVETLNQKFVTGELSDVHQLTIASQKASLGLELTVQVRNKVIEAYQEIMRMQI